METTELDSEGSAIPATQSQTVRKNISLKLKGKGKGTHAYKGRTPRKKEVPAPVTAVVENIIENEIKADIIDTSLLKATIDEEELFKLEPPTFITSNSGPPEPMHHGMKLRWDYKVNLMGTKVVNPLIHTCKKCSIPILLYGRMIPCKHVFCFDCANKSDKVCFRCSEKVSRVEQTSLGTLFTCVYGGSKRNGSDGCSRTYLSQRDLQAHINHRHLRQVAPSSTTTPTTTAVNPVSKGSSIELQRPSMSNTTPHVHTSDYRSRPHGNKSQLQVAADANYRPHVIGSLMSQLNPYPSDVHHGYERSNAIVTAVTSMAHQMVPPPVLSPYPLTVVSQAGAQVGVHPSICVPIVTAAGTTAVQPYDSTPIPVVSVPSANVIVPPPTRTNLITVPIHDDTAAQTPPSDYLQNPYHQHGATQQQAYLPPMVGPPYTTPPPVSYPTTYCTPTIATTFPPPQAPHYPPPPLYSTQLPPPTVPHHQVPRYSTPPPRYGNPPTQTTQYEDHSRLGSSQYPPVPWGNQQRVNTAHQHPPPIGPPPQTRPPFY